MTDLAAIEASVLRLEDPSVGMSLATTRARVQATAQSDTQIQVKITLAYPFQGVASELHTQWLAALQHAFPGLTFSLSLEMAVVAHKVQAGVAALEGVKNIIAVASGKGGVGKSTTSVNLALALSEEGARVGILDADIYGPSQPRMLGSVQKPESKDGKHLEPIQRYGIDSMSIGYLIDEEQPMIWRGPMVTQALQQMLTDTRWQDLDYLVIDLPPGTGDIQLTLSQKVPVSGAVIVTTPQDISLLDARKALKMFEKVKVPVLGVIENMSTHICSQCGHEEPIFGAGGGQSMAQQYAVDLLGSLPLDMRIREDADGGQPTVVREPDGEIAHNYRQIARKVAAHLATQAKNYAAAFPNIVIKAD